MKKFKFLSLSLIIVSALFLSACSFYGDNNEPNDSNNISGGSIVDDSKDDINNKNEKENQIQKFASVQDLKLFLKQNQYLQNYNYLSRGSAEMDMMIDSVSPTLQKEAINPTASFEENLDYSETNVQVEGVDEADIVKTDGNNIYTISDKKLFLLSAYPGEEAKIQSVIEFDNRPSNLYLNNDKLVVLGYNYNIYSNVKRIMPDILPRGSYMFVKIFDVSNINEPSLEKEWEFEGNYNESRLLNEELYVIANKHVYYSADEPVLPVVLEDGNLRNFDCGGDDCLQTNVYYFPRPYHSYNYTSVYKLDLNNLEKDVKSSTFLIDNGQTVYMSHNNLYLSYSSYIDHQEVSFKVMREMIYPYLDKEEQVKIDNIESAPEYILSDKEKQSKVVFILENFLDTQNQAERKIWEENIKKAVKDKYISIADKVEATVIQKISLKADDLKPVVQGQVPGIVLNQFSIDEYQGNLRIATTRSNNWQNYVGLEDGGSENNVYILDGNLERLSSVENLAKGERIYSARFIGDRIYLVTFKQVDPLFVIDASNAKNPKVLGELKMPGFSNYLHPYDENTLIGFGKDTYVDDNNNVRTKSLKLSLFDVTNPVEPKEIDTYITGGVGSSSEVLNDHKALLFSKQRELLVLPVRLKSEDNTWKNSFNGVLVFNTEDKEFSLRGRINHVKGSSDWQKYYNNQIKRSLYIEDQLYTISDNTVQINELESLDFVKDINLDYQNSDFNVINLNK
jgi:uncharacterized secreted protein with C-terminal beta-propeller domain